jgi:carbamoyl-phosphate synthase large subunit
MPKDPRIKKVMVIGSGPIIIGQAAEFDYAGTQACRVLKEEGIEVVLANSNPATIMTDNEIADKVYIEPLTLDVASEILRKERPDSLLPTLGGQTGLNLAMELAESGILEELGVRLLGTAVESIKASEDREAFKDMMLSIGEPVINSIISTDTASAIEFAEKEGYPVIIRPAYTLGGTGGGIAGNRSELDRIAHDGLMASRVHQILVEKSVSGWKEIEYEVLRDSVGNVVTVCNMENFDPVGIHTGDSIVVAPSQTLRDVEHQMLRSASLNIINALGIEGGCNVQYALNTNSLQYYVIEVNPRVSRSSALASKATGYPIAKVATRIAIGYTLDEILNGVTGKNYACFEPTLDYVVVKFPRWPFDKFTEADNRIGTRMKATGEVMSIAPTFEAALLKAVRSLETGQFSLDNGYGRLSDYEVEERLYAANNERMFAIAEALRRGIPQALICSITKVDPWFITKLANIVTEEKRIQNTRFDLWTKETMLRTKQMGISDKAIAVWQGVSEMEVRELRKRLDVLPAFRMVDTCGAEFEAVSPYYYSCYGAQTEAKQSPRPTVVVLGSGPIRIGQGVEFDFCSVHCIWSLKRMGYDTVIINNNPETVSTDFDVSDRLYFEPLTAEEMWNVLDVEKPVGVVVQFGGQTAIKLAKYVKEAGYRILGTSLESIDAAEDRKLFNALLEQLKIPQPKGATVFTEDEAVAAAEKLGYPVLVRPSYVLGGQGMEIAYNEENIRRYMRIINRTTQEHPILVDKYLVGMELEVDAISDGETVLIPGIMEHIERAGIHSGDSISVYPAQHISKKMEARIIEVTTKLAKSLNVKGVVNIQFINYNEELYVIEVNPRSSRTIPYITKVTGIPMVEYGMRAAMGEKLKALCPYEGLYPSSDIIAVKVPVFSFEKLSNVEVSLGPEMKSTGEVLGISPTLRGALAKGLKAAGARIRRGDGVFISVSDNAKHEMIAVAKRLVNDGFKLYATCGTARYLRENGIETTLLDKPESGSLDEIRQMLYDGKIKLIIDTPTLGRIPKRFGFKLRRMAVECSAQCMTSLDTVNALLDSLEADAPETEPISLSEIKFAAC